MASAVGAHARRLAMAARVWEFRPAATARSLVPVRRSFSSRAASSSTSDEISWPKAIFAGGVVFLCYVGKVFLDLEAALRKEQMEFEHLTALSRQKDEEIARLERAWEEEVAAREKVKSSS